MSTTFSVDSFKQSFREEAREILIDLEAALLALNVHRDDLEIVGRAFRALHTIKGSGSMFGFDELAAFTHNLENAFDEVRNGRLAVTSELIDLTLLALDQIKALLEENATSAQPEVRAQIISRLRSLTPSAEVEAAASGRTEAVAVTADVEQSQWRIHFAPGPEFTRNGTDPLLLLRELRQLGELEIRASFESMPALADLDPARCYVSWDMVLSAPVNADAIRDVFIFVEDICELSIDAISIPAKASEIPALSELELVSKEAADPRAQGARRFHDQPDNASSIRVPAAKLDQFVDLVGELVTVQARLSEIATRHDDPDVLAVSEEIDRLTSALRENSMNIRMLPIRATFERFRRLVHDLARDLHKDVDLTIEGAETELDKTVIDQLSDPLMHLIRNSMDHGIEPSELRLAHGKQPTATIHLSARHSGANVLISVADDGGGIKVAAVRARAIEKGLISEEMQLAESEILAMIFEPGFSTAKQITDVSGRGVGMDVVRQRVESLRGTVEVASKPGIGTSVTLRLPLTLAIIDGLLVRVGKAFFVLPLANTLECIELSREDSEKANGKHVAIVRGEIIPYIRLRQYFNIVAEPLDREQIMVVETEEGRCGFVVDEVLGDYQTVIKNLGRFYRHVQVVSGATILGNGTVALILDPHRLVQDAIRAGATPRARSSPTIAGGNRARDGSHANTS